MPEQSNSVWPDSLLALQVLNWSGMYQAQDFWQAQLFLPRATLEHES